MGNLEYVFYVVLLVLGVVITVSQVRQADAQDRQADALENIARAVCATVFDDQEGPSDSTRLVRALEKLAGIEPPPEPPESGDEDEPHPAA